MSSVSSVVPVVAASRPLKRRIEDEILHEIQADIKRLIKDYVQEEEEEEEEEVALEEVEEEEEEEEVDLEVAPEEVLEVEEVLEEGGGVEEGEEEVPEGGEVAPEEERYALPIPADVEENFCIIFEHCLNLRTIRVGHHGELAYNKALAAFLTSVPDMDPDLYRDAGHAKAFVQTALDGYDEQQKAFGKRILMALIMSGGNFTQLDHDVLFPLGEEEEEEEEPGLLLSQLMELVGADRTVTLQDMEIIEGAVNLSVQALDHLNDLDEHRCRQRQREFFESTNIGGQLVALTTLCALEFMDRPNPERAQKSDLEILNILLAIPGIRERLWETNILEQVALYFEYLKTPSQDMSATVAASKRRVANLFVHRMGRPLLV